MTLLTVTSLSETERNYWRQTLLSYLWSLRVMSRASDPMRYAVNRLEGGVLRGLEHALAVNLSLGFGNPLGPGAEGFGLNQPPLPDLANMDLSELELQHFDWLSSATI
jgi:hypothetical protein